MDNAFTAGRDFIRRQGRLVERRLFATCFEGAPAGGVTDALRGYRNTDGGFGHGLEPDKRCPASLPIDVEVALATMATTGTTDRQLVLAACDYLAKVAAEVDCGGAVPLAFPVIESYPRAAHWSDWTYAPALNPTAGLAGLCQQLGIKHPWVTQASAWCWDQLSGAELPDDVHALSEILVFLAHSPERERADAVAATVRTRLDSAAMFLTDPDAQGYGLSPLSLAPNDDSRWRGLFSVKMIDGHLDRLLAQQQEDGGWPITWEPPGEAAMLEWRGIVTLAALRTLVSYGRLSPAA